MGESLLAGKRGVITGVANDKSIAWACAEACRAHGAELAFTYLGEAQEKRVKALIDASMPGALMAPCDVTKDEEIAKFFDAV